MTRVARTFTVPRETTLEITVAPPTFKGKGQKAAAAASAERSGEREAGRQVLVRARGSLGRSSYEYTHSIVNGISYSIYRNKTHAVHT